MLVGVDSVNTQTLQLLACLGWHRGCLSAWHGSYHGKRLLAFSTTSCHEKILVGKILPIDIISGLWSISHHCYYKAILVFSKYWLA